MAKFTDLTTALVTKNNQIAQIEEKISQQVAAFQNQLVVLRDEDRQLRQMIKNAMEAKGLKNYEDDFIALTFVAETTRNTLDATSIKKDLPQLYEKYLKVGKVSSSVRIKIKEQIKEQI